MMMTHVGLLVESLHCDCVYNAWLDGDDDDDDDNDDDNVVYGDDHDDDDGC